MTAADVGCAGAGLAASAVGRGGSAFDVVFSTSASAASTAAMATNVTCGMPGIRARLAHNPATTSSARH